MSEIIRTKREGCFRRVESKAWGYHLCKVDDPLSTVEKIEKTFELQKDFPKIPSNLWSALVSLYFNYAKFKSLEVSVLLLRKEEDLSQWKIVVPKQEVTRTSVRADNFNDCCDLLTGEEYTSFPPQGYLHCGSSHTHSTMKLSTFSSTDDENELTLPGLHILISNIDLQKNTYVTTASIVLRKERYILNSESVVDFSSISSNDCFYHPNVKAYIQEKKLDKVNKFSDYSSKHVDSFYAQKQSWVLTNLPFINEEKDEDDLSLFEEEVENILMEGLLSVTDLKRKIDEIEQKLIQKL